MRSEDGAAVRFLPLPPEQWTRCSACGRDSGWHLQQCSMAEREKRIALWLGSLSGAQLGRVAAWIEFFVGRAEVLDLTRNGGSR